MAARQNRKSNLFWRIAISLVGVALILMALVNLLLFFLGETATGAVTTRRYGGERQGSVNDKRYTWSVDYTFTANDGETYDGHTTKLGSATSVQTSKTIYYFTFAPFINTPEDTAEPNLGQLVLLAAGVFCLVVMNRKSSRNIRAKKTVQAGQAAEPVLTDYDDSIEEYDHQEVIMDQYCTHCGTKLPAGARFCRNCGQPAAAAQPATSAPQSATAAETTPPPYAAPAPQYYTAAAPQPPYGAGYAPRQPLVGWTERHLDPSVLARASKTRRTPGYSR